MNRELKFRAYDKLLKLYVKRCEMLDITNNFYGDTQCCSISDMVFQQYTGLKDKNGVEIYEGDIIAFGSTEQEDLFKVVWDDDDVRFVLYSYGGKGCWFTDVKDREVIGNIFENSELLKQ